MATVNMTPQEVAEYNEFIAAKTASAISAAVKPAASKPAASKAKATTGDPKTDPLAFTYLCIKKLRQVDGQSKGIHSVFSGFNAGFRAQFPNLDVIQWTTSATASGKIQSHFVRRGLMIYLPGEMPIRAETSGSKILETIFA